MVVKTVTARNCEVIADKSDADQIGSSVTKFFSKTEQKQQEIKKTLGLQT